MTLQKRRYPFFEVLTIGAVVLAAVFGLYLGISWVASAPKSGTVEAAWLVPAHSERYQSGSVCFSYDAKDHHCTLSMPIYSTRWVPDACHVTLRDVDKGREWTWAVPCADLATFKVGQYGAVK